MTWQEKIKIALDHGNTACICFDKENLIESLIQGEFPDFQIKAMAAKITPIWPSISLEKGFMGNYGWCIELKIEAFYQGRDVNIVARRQGQLAKDTHEHYLLDKAGQIQGIVSSDLEKFDKYLEYLHKELPISDRQLKRDLEKQLVGKKFLTADDLVRKFWQGYLPEEPEFEDEIDGPDPFAIWPTLENLDLLAGPLDF